MTTSKRVAKVAGSQLRKKSTPKKNQSSRWLRTVATQQIPKKV